MTCGFRWVVGVFLLAGGTSATVDDLVEATVSIVGSDAFGGTAYTVYLLTEVSEASGAVEQVVNGVLQGLPCPVVVESRWLRRYKRRRQFNVLVVDRMEAFEVAFARMSPEFYDFSGFYVVTVIHQLDHGMIRQLLELLWRKYIVNVCVVMWTADAVLLYAYSAYGPDRCEVVRPLVWNTFRKGSWQYPERTFFPVRLKNFHRCPLRVALFAQGPFMRLVMNPRDEILDVSGIDGTLLKYLSRSLNFTAEYIQEPDRLGIVYRNGTANGALGAVMDGQVNLTLGYIGYNYVRLRYLSLSQVYYSSSLVLVVSPGEEYSPFEKLLLPFADGLWILLAVYLVVAFATIATVNRMRLTIREFTFGRDTGSPALNVVRIFLGGALARTPSRNFARFVLFLWTYQALVVRSVYQQALFGYLQSAGNHSAPRYLGDIVAHDLYLYTAPNEMFLFESVPELRNRLRPITAAERALYYRRIRLGQVRGARIGYYEQILDENSRVSDGQHFRMLRDKLYNNLLCVALRQYSCLTKPFDDSILKLNSNGLVLAWARRFVDRKWSSVPFRAKVTPRVSLTVRQLLGGFELLAFGLVVAVGVFAGELLAGRKSVRPAVNAND